MLDGKKIPPWDLCQMPREMNSPVLKIILIFVPKISLFAKNHKIAIFGNMPNLGAKFLASNSNCVQIGQILYENKGFWVLQIQR